MGEQDDGIVKEYVPGSTLYQWRLQTVAGELDAVYTLQNKSSGSYLGREALQVGGDLKVQLSNNPELQSSQWHVQAAEELQSAVRLDSNGRLVLAAHPSFCLDAALN